jgi:hypothetical protein
VHGSLRGHGHDQGLGIGHAHVFGGEPHGPPRDGRVFPASSMRASQ